MRRILDRARQWRFDRVAALTTALVLLIAGVTMAAFNEADYRAQKSREIGVQAQILSSSVTAALMFNDSVSAQDYLNALSANPDVEAAAVYEASGLQIAEFSRPPSAPPPEAAGANETRMEHGRFVTVAPVARDGVALGAVYLRTNTESPARRVSRYVAIGILFVLAALVLVVLGLAQGALSRANTELAGKARDLQVQIEERERAEEALLQSRKMEAIGQLTGGIAHDFNNLLMVVISGLRLLERHDDPERRVKTMEAMRQAVERGAGLTRQLLAFSRRQTLRLEAVDVARQLTGMRELLERSLRADILVEMMLPDGLWPVKTDPAQLELAVLNLAVNARDAMPKGGVITISAANVTRRVPGGDSEFVEITVRDTGFGIPPELMDRVFEPYFTTKQTGQGTGLGLSQVYGFVSQSGGAVRMESVVNQGTSIALALPRSDVEAAAPAPVTPKVETPKREMGESVLVVEDDDHVAAFVNDMLTQLGYKPTRVSNANAALGALANEREFNLVFSDIVMPGGMNGIELAREIRRLHPRLPIVMTTGFSGGPAEAPEFPLLRKPYQMEDLERVIGAALAQKP
ncbi:MAG: ATP-binding protein [Terricaulis sp.]